MDKIHVALGVAVVALVVWRGIYANSPVPSDGQPTVHLGRGNKPVGSVIENLHSTTVDGANSQTARGSYPPRALGLTAQRQPPSDSWLLAADSDHERFRRIEVALRGLDVAMLEIGMRFDALHDAIDRGNFARARYEVTKISEVAQIAMLKRPAFGNHEALSYLGGSEWTTLANALHAQDIERSRAAFLQVRRSCVACHSARGLDHLNQSGLFDDTARFSNRRAAAGSQPIPARSR